MSGILVGANRHRLPQPSRGQALASLAGIGVLGVALAAASPASAYTPSTQSRYDLAGTATLKTLVKGTLPLSGAVSADFDLTTGNFSGDLTLNETTGKLVALGFLPVTAKVQFVSVGPTTGTLTGAVLRSNSKVRIKLPSVTLFGLKLAGGSACQTKSVSNIALQSAPGFNQLEGGSLTGTFVISDLTGCGSLTGLVSPLTAGKGNAIAIRLTPEPVTPQPTTPPVATTPAPRTTPVTTSPPWQTTPGLTTPPQTTPGPTTPDTTTPAPTQPPVLPGTEPIDTPIDTPPYPPTDLVGEATDASVSLRWTAATDDVGVVGYDVYQDGLVAKRVTDTTATLTGLAPGRTYSFRVAAVDTVGHSAATYDILLTTSGIPGGSSKTLNVTALCKWPLVGAQPVNLQLTADTPSRVLFGTELPPIKLSGIAIAAGKTNVLFDLAGGDRLSGGGSFSASYALPGIGRLPMSIPVTLDPYPIAAPAQTPTVFTFAGETPPITVPSQAGNATLSLTGLRFNLRLRSAETGNDQEFPDLKTDVDGNLVTPSDADPGTFDVYCRFDAGQNLTFASIVLASD